MSISNSTLSSPGHQSVWDVSGTAAIPDDKLPQCWQDDTRMGFLFSSFYPRDTNPLGYDGKMRFWAEMLELWCAECRRASFSLALLEKAFRRKNVRPACLQTFIDELVRTGKIMTEEQFMSWDRTESWGAWAMKTVVARPAVWSFSKLKEALIATDPAQVRYVSLEHLKIVGDRISKEFGKSESNVMAFAQFEEIVGEDAEHVLRWMKNHKTATEAVFSEERWIKIGKEPIAESDVVKLVLRKDISRLHGLIDELEESILKLDEDARTNLRNKKRESAKRCLKEKRLVEKKITETWKRLGNVEALLNSLMDVQSNSEILNVYQLGINSLKAANSGLKEDAVINTMTELEEVLEETNDISRSMMLEVVSDKELEEELQSILATCNQPTTGDITPSSLDLPDVPVSEPSPGLHTHKPEPLEPTSPQVKIPET